MIHLLNFLADYDFDDFDHYDNFDKQVNFSATIGIVIGVIAALMFLAIFVTIIVVIVKNKNKIAKAGKDMFGAISEGISDIGTALGDAAKSFTGKTKPQPEDEYTNCQYCGSSVNTKNNKCPNCGASIKRKTK